MLQPAVQCDHIECEKSYARLDHVLAWCEVLQSSSSPGCMAFFLPDRVLKSNGRIRLYAVLFLHENPCDVRVREQLGAEALQV